MTDGPQGYLPEELERGDDQPGCTLRLRPLGCIAISCLIAAVGYGISLLARSAGW